MTKVDKLISDLCPEGVNQRELGSVASIIRGNRVTKKDLLVDGVYPVVSGGIGYMGYINNYNREPETITIAQYGTAGYVKWQTEKFWANDVCFSVIPNAQIIDNRYLYFLLSNKQRYLYEISNRNAVPYSIDREKILKINIPVPPLEVQRYIVDILNKFTQLEAELEAELEARKKQYLHYRNQLLTFDDAGGVQWMALANIVKMARGVRVVKKDLDETGEIPVYQNSMTPLGFFDKSNHKPETTFIITAGAAGDVGYSEVAFWAADDCFALVCPESLSDRFLYHFLKTKQDYLYSRVRRASVPRLSRTIIEKIQIPLPPISEQNRIVSMLDKFDNLVNDISKGLPAELKARRQQYEYYRNKLLTFQESTV